MPSTSSVVRGVTIVEPAGAFNFPVKSSPVSMFLPPVTTIVAVQAVLNLKKPLESVATVTSPTSAEPFPLLSHNTVAPLR